jgi:hypothetical protein
MRCRTSSGKATTGPHAGRKEAYRALKKPSPRYRFFKMPEPPPPKPKSKLLRIDAAYCTEDTDETTLKETVSAVLERLQEQGTAAVVSVSYLEDTVEEAQKVMYSMSRGGEASEYNL